MKTKVSRIIPILLIIIFVAVSGCSQINTPENIEKSEITEEQLVSLQLPVLEYINEDKAFGVNGCSVVTDEVSGLVTMYIDANEEDGVDYEAYKEKIWEEVGAEFNIIFELIPFPIVPTIAGVIRAIEFDDHNDQEGYIGTIIVVSQTSDSVSGNGEAYYDASRISVYKNDPIIKKSGETLTFDNLKIGMYVDSYYRGVTLTTYPGLQGTEKLVIHEDFQMPMASDSMSKAIMKEIFNNEEMTGPYPIAISRYAKELLQDDTRLWVRVGDGGMVFYSDIETLESPEVYISSLYIHYDSKSGVTSENKILNVVIKADEDIALTIDENSIRMEITIFENDKLQNVIYVIDEEGQLSKGQ